MPNKCECTSDCDHHKGNSCPAEAHTLSTEWILDGELKKGHPILLRHCLLCIVKEEERRQAKAGKT
jgi:hypothetical protein